MDEIDPPNADDFVILYGPRLGGLQNDAKSVSAAVFKRKHGIAPQDYRKRITRFKEPIKGQDPINGPREDEFVQLTCLPAGGPWRPDRRLRHCGLSDHML